MDLATLLLSSTLSAAADLTIPGDWHISTHVARTNSSIVVNGSVFLEPGGVLELSGCTLQVLCTYDRQFNLTWRGGSPVSRDSTVGGYLSAAEEATLGRVITSSIAPSCRASYRPHSSSSPAAAGVPAA